MADTPPTADEIRNALLVEIQTRLKDPDITAKGHESMIYLLKQVSAQLGVKPHLPGEG